MRKYEFISEKISANAASDAGNSSALTNVKQAIITKIDAVTDIDELHQIYSYVRKIDIGGGVDNILQKDEDLRQVHTIVSRAIIDAKAPYEEKEGFATELATKGIINIKKLLSPGVSQNLESVIQTQFPNVYQQVAPELIAIQGLFKTGKTKTQKGPGEMFLAICSPNIMLSKDAGDLVINGKLIEVKGNGGRIKGVRGYGNSSSTLTAVKTAAAALPKKLKLKTAITAPSNVNVGKTSDFWTNFGPSLIAAGAPAAGVVKFIRTSLSGIINSIYLDATPAELQQLVAPVNNKGMVLFDPFIAAQKKYAFDYYKSHDEFKGILFINTGSGTTIYIETAEQFAQSMIIQKIGLNGGAQNGMQVKVP